MIVLVSWDASAYCPSCGEIIAGDINLTCDLINCSGDGLLIAGNDTTLDCKGYKIVGMNAGSSYGITSLIFSIDADNNTIKNCVVTGFSIGIKIYDFSNYNIINNTVNNNKGDGINVIKSSNNNIINNTANSNGVSGIFMALSSNNIIAGNTANNNVYGGIYLESPSNNTLINNTTNSNNVSFFSAGIFLRYGSDNTLINNTANSNVYGIWLYGISNNNTLDSNIVCSNGRIDINNEIDSGLTSGDNNTCDATIDWNDYGLINTCTLHCNPEIYSAGSSALQNEFNSGENVSAYSSKLARKQVNVCVCIVSDKDWSDEDTFSGTCYPKTTDISGNLNYEYLWTPNSSEAGDYDIVLDVDCDNVYGAYRDAVDSLNMGQEGFYITPEPMAAVLFIAGLSVVYGFVRIRKDMRIR